MRRLGTTLTALLLAAALAPAATAAKRQRPDAVPAAAEAAAPNAIQVFNDYVAPARTYSSQRAVVHYVTLGVSAPPLNDDNADGVPDYVERVGAAADTALAYYERRGFARVLADAGGRTRGRTSTSRASPPATSAWPSPRPTPRAAASSPCRTGSTRARRRASAASTAPSRTSSSTSSSSRTSAASRRSTTGCSRGQRPRWRRACFPEVEDIVSSLQLRHWFAAPRQPVTAQSYGAQLLWHWLDERTPALLPSLLARRSRATRRGRRRCLQLRTSGSRAGRSPARSASYAAWVAGAYGDRLEHLPLLGPRAHRVRRPSGDRLRPRAAVTRSVDGPLRARPRPGGARATRSRARAAGEPSAERRLAARTVGGTFTFRIPAALRASDGYERPTLVVANGGTAGAVRYRASAA